jgi:exopolysaccharide biosynthesis polyprenyl glycosylphosphotransferase
MILMDRKTFPSSAGALLTQLGPLRVLIVGVFLMAWGVWLSWWGFYEERRLATGAYEGRMVAACVLGSAALTILPSPAAGNLGLAGALLFGLLSSLLIGFNRLVGRALLGLRSAPSQRNIVIVGGGPRAHAIERELRHCHTQYNVFGFVDDEAGTVPTAEMPRLGGIGQLETILRQRVVDEVCIALPVKSHYDSFQEAIAVCERTGVEFSYPLDTFTHRLTRPRISQSHGRVSVETHPVLYDENLQFKRMMDLVVASGMCLALLPAIVGIAISIKLTSPGPVFFSQQRYGKNKRLFRMYKFRTMCTDAEVALQRDSALYTKYSENNFKLPPGCDQRVTPVGRLLRKTSLDEIPQLWNVLRGDMSLVGPRPIVPAELEMYGSASSLLLALKPGCTGIWVVEGRSSVSYPRRAELELQYVRNWSLLRDLGILFRTVIVVLRGNGAH